MIVASCGVLTVLGVGMGCMCCKFKMHDACGCHPGDHDIFTWTTHAPRYRTKKVNCRRCSGTCRAILGRVSTSLEADSNNYQPASPLATTLECPNRMLPTVTRERPIARKLFFCIYISTSLLLSSSAHRFHRVLINQPWLQITGSTIDDIHRCIPPPLHRP